MSTFSCYVCWNKNTPCSSQTFRKENFANCEAASKSLGFPAFETALECQNYCSTNTVKPIDINPVCWLCQGDGTCDHFLAFNGECPKGRNVFERREDCMAHCSAITPLNPPIQPIGPVPVVPLNPPIQPIYPFVPILPPVVPILPPYVPVFPPIVPILPPVVPILPPVAPPIQPIGPIPAIPIEPVKDDKWLYIIIAIVVFILMALLVGGLIIFL